MQVEYETTLDEIAETHVRAALRSKTVRRQQIIATFCTGSLTAVLLFLWLSLEDEEIGIHCVFAGFAGVVSAGIYWMVYRPSMKRRVRKYVREKFQTKGPLPFAVELREDCIWAKFGGTQLSFDWSNLQEIIDSPDGVELIMRDGGFVFVRSRGFPSREAQDQFKEIANRRMDRVSGKSAEAVHP